MEEKTAHPETNDEQVSESRRKLLKAVAATGGAVVASALMPSEWAEPVVEAGVMPAHAQQLSPSRVIIENLRPGEAECHDDILFDFNDGGCGVDENATLRIWVDCGDQGLGPKVEDTIVNLWGQITGGPCTGSILVMCVSNLLYGAPGRAVVDLCQVCVQLVVGTRESNILCMELPAG
jgi:hypothetical protein